LPIEYATRLIPSEMFLVKMTSVAEFVGGPVDVGVVPLVELGQRVDDLAWLLRGVGAVQVDERLPAANSPVQDREVLADARDVEGHEAAPAFTQRS
jgi:hypothetical protein